MHASSPCLESVVHTLAVHKRQVQPELFEDEVRTISASLPVLACVVFLRHAPFVLPPAQPH